MQLQINDENRELKEHGTFAFPVMVSYEVLSSYDRGSFFWHWHPEIELTLILSGEISYQVNDTTFPLTAGDGLFCNSNMPHTGKMHHHMDCNYISITFDPKIIYGFEGSLLQTKYVTPMTLNSQLASMALASDIPWQKNVLAAMAEIWKLAQEKPDTYEFQVQALLSKIWLMLYKNAAPQTESLPSVVRDRERVLAILSYLHEHFSEKITLEDIAARINICASECCRLFKRNMKESIFDYLIRYRIEKSLSLLEHTTDSITDISLNVGFSNPCYFSKVFRAETGYSPREYRNEKTAAKE